MLGNKRKTCRRKLTVTWHRAWANCKNWSRLNLRQLFGDLWRPDTKPLNRLSSSSTEWCGEWGESVRKLPFWEIEDKYMTIYIPAFRGWSPWFEWYRVVHHPRLTMQTIVEMSITVHIQKIIGHIQGCRVQVRWNVFRLVFEWRSVL